MNNYPKPHTCIIFTVSDGKGSITEREAYVFNEPMFYTSLEFAYAADSRYLFASEIPEPKNKWILKHDELKYVKLVGIGEFETVEEVRSFYERNMRFKILDWVEIKI